MKTYAETEREQARKFNRMMADELYGLGYLNEPMPPENEVVDARYKIEWPPGYWEEYDQLRKDALRVSSALLIHMVMGITGKYRVYALMPKGSADAGPMWGPEGHDRLAAWKAFIETFEKVVIAVPAGTVQLGAPDKNNDVMVDGEKLTKHLKGVEKSLQTLAGNVPPAEPKKGRKGRK